MNGAIIDKAAIRRLIPHAGVMCLLDEVLSWDEASIHCRSTTHRDAAHPLARGGRLAALHLLEYGAQAMAIHGGLRAATAGGAAAPGVLVSARAVQLEVEHIDDIEAALDIRAQRLVASGGGWLYGFDVSAAGRRLATGRVAVIPSGNANLPSP